MTTINIKRFPADLWHEGPGGSGTARGDHPGVRCGGPGERTWPLWALGARAATFRWRACGGYIRRGHE